MIRAAALDQLRSQEDPFDIIVVGGGATGLGAAVDAAARGHRVLLMEQADFAQGTSSRSTKLVHGGVRYLRQGNISLVLEALRERGYLCQNAPHLVRNMAFVIPTYKWWEGPFYGVGMKVYDRLAGDLGLNPSTHLSKKEVLQAIPTIETRHLTGGVEYHDGQFDDARLAVNLAQTAVNSGACVLNHLQCVGLVKEGGQVRGVLAQDTLDGHEVEVRGKAVINATGVFADELRRWDDADAPGVIAVSQGIHLVLPKSFLPGDAAIMIPKTEDDRVLFCVPWHDRVIVGTTDTPMNTPDLEPRALREERDFVMEHAAKYLAKDPGQDDVLSVFAGLRPLVKSYGHGGTASLSRDHTLLVSRSGLLTVTGGKWTTYRKMAEDVVDQAETLAGIQNRDCPTKSLQIHGWTRDAIPEAHLEPYGADAEALRRIAAEAPDLDEPLHPRLPCRKYEVLWHTRHEMACKVEDVLARRTRALLLDAVASTQAAESVAHIMAKELGKDDEWIHQQTRAYHALARGYTFNDPASVSPRNLDS